MEFFVGLSVGSLISYEWSRCSRDSTGVFLLLPTIGDVLSDELTWVDVPLLLVIGPPPPDFKSDLLD